MYAKQQKIFSKLEMYAKEGVHVRSSRHAAAITYKGIIIAKGRNSYKTHPIMNKWGKNSKSIYLHAEIAALLEFLKNFPPDFASKCEMFVLRINKKEEVSSSCPCKGCQKAIDFYKFKKVYWT